MKKLNFAIFGALMLTCLTTPAFAETTIPWTKEGCESVKGTWITAHSPDDDGCDAAHCNGLNFCRSNKQMNWFSALIWCKSIGRELTDVETACPNGLASGNVCPNLDGFRKVYMWTSTPCSSTNSYMIHQSSASPIWCSYSNRNLSSQNYALCK